MMISIFVIFSSISKLYSILLSLNHFINLFKISLLSKWGISSYFPNNIKDKDLSEWTHSQPNSSTKWLWKNSSHFIWQAQVKPMNPISALNNSNHSTPMTSITTMTPFTTDMKGTSRKSGKSSSWSKKVSSNLICWCITLGMSSIPPMSCIIIFLSTPKS